MSRRRHRDRPADVVEIRVVGSPELVRKVLARLGRVGLVVAGPATYGTRDGSGDQRVYVHVQMTEDLPGSG